ncbi:MAG: YbhB/YbcL family Raf kinase inhibitor-like protein, partial [Polyangia bacterium]
MRYLPAMHPLKVRTGIRAPWTVVACGVTALIVAGCGGSSGDSSATGGRVGSGGATVATGGTTAGTGGSTEATGGASAGTGGSTDGSGGASAGTGGSAAGTGGTSPGTGGAAAGTGGGVAGTGGRGGGAGSVATGGTGVGGGGATGQGGRGMLTLSSTTLTDNGTFMAANNCAGSNQSPPLTWTAGPAGTQSYAIVLLDTANSRYHWAIWNIPASVMALPAALPAGATITTPVAAMQAITGSGTPSYQGPCPNGTSHTYVFTLYALD